MIISTYILQNCILTKKVIQYNTKQHLTTSEATLTCQLNNNNKQQTTNNKQQRRPHSFALLFLPTFFFGPLCNTKAQAREVQIGLSDEQWQATLKFEKDCLACRSCYEESYGFGERLKEQYNPTNAEGTDFFFAHYYWHSTKKSK